MKSKLSPVISKSPRLRVGLKDVSREEFSAAVNERLGKQRVSIMLDGSIIAFFKAKAGERGYQTLINQALNYAYLVPFVEEEDYFFLKTVIPSRKATRDYLNQGETDAEN
jgi:uncharacterized protein (DUF4415 family)